MITDLVYEKYRLVCPYGILSELYSADEIEIYNGLIEFEYQKINKTNIAACIKAINHSNKVRKKIKTKKTMEKINK